MAQTFINRNMTEKELSELVDEGYALVQEIKVLEAQLSEIKAVMKRHALATGVTEYMGERSKCIISARNTTTIDPRKCHKLMKKQGNEALFWSIIKVSIEAARKNITADFDTVATVTSDPFATIAFK